MADKLGTHRSVLLVEDDSAVRRFLQRALEREGFAVVPTDDLAAAREAIGAAPISFDLAMVDQELPDGSGLDLLQEIAEAEIDTRVVMVTGHGELACALRAMRLGASDYVEKPFTDLDAFRECLARGLRAHDAHRDRRALVDELRTKNQELEALAVRDPLTRVYNHAHLQETIGRELLRSKRNGLSCALLLIELDGLRALNHTQGHAGGDRLLRAIAALLDGRTPDLPDDLRLRAQDFVARYAGATFALLLPETPKTGAATTGERLRSAIAEHDFSGDDLPSQTVSIGVTAFPTDAQEHETFVTAAASALYAARAGGRNRMVAYSSKIATIRGRDDTAVRTELAQLDALDRAIATRDFDFVYQPIVRAKTGTVFAYEALCRPRNTAQFPNPYMLIKTAESAGRVCPLGRALRENAVSALPRLPRNSILFLNVHPHELFDPEFISIEPFVASWTDQIVLEITEVANLKDYARVREIMAQLRGAGFRVALDDLGAGYSGLNSLAMLRPDFVKLDMQLVRGASDPRTARLIKHIVEFSTDEDMMVVAEGIETEDERAALTELGCDLLQGYLFAKGRPIDDILADLHPPRRAAPVG